MSAMSTMTKGPEDAPASSKFYTREHHDAFHPPEPADLIHETKLVHGTLYLEKTGSSSLFSYALQRKHDNKDGTKRVVVLTAEKDKKSKSPFIIKNVTTKKEVGRVVMQFKTMKYISYAVFRGETQVASIVYHVPTIRAYLNLDPPRMAQMVLSDPIEKNPTWLAEESPGLLLLTNSIPYKKPDGTYGLNFNGRGQQASCRNMQLLDFKDAVICQVAKWDTNVYNVDFAAPCSSFLALAFALAQLDI